MTEERTESWESAQDSLSSVQLPLSKSHTYLILMEIINTNMIYYLSISINPAVYVHCTIYTINLHTEKLEAWIQAPFAEWFWKKCYSIWFSGVTTMWFLNLKIGWSLSLPASFEVKAVLIYAKLANFLCCILFPDETSKKWHNKMLLWEWGTKSQY